MMKLSLRWIIASLLLLAAGSVYAAPIYAVLTNNANAEEPALESSCTYTAEPDFDNPPDPLNTRLTDGDPVSDWSTTAGINFKDQSVTFDFKEEYLIGRASLLFDMDAKPDKVLVKTSTDGANWTDAGSITPESRNGWYTLEPARPAKARYVRFDFKLREWGWYLREVKIWGKHGDEKTPQRGYYPTSNKPGIVLTKDAEPTSCIVVADRPSSKALKAAFFLQDYIYKISGVRLAIHSESKAPDTSLILVGASKFTAKMGIRPVNGYPNAEKVVIKTGRNRIALVGNDDAVYNGTENAVRLLLMKLGCGWFTPDSLWQPVEKTRTVVVPEMDISHTPAFDLRDVWIGLKYKWLLGGPPINASHAHDTLFPPSQYFADHPEYYSLIDGKRTAEGEWQLCTSNPNVRRLLAEKANKFFDENPHQIMFSLSNNDTGGFCECDECKKTGSSEAARMLDLCNYVAKEVRKTHKDRWIIFYAYWYTQKAPEQGIKAEPGVAVMVVNEACHAHALTDKTCPRNASWAENFEKWCNTGAKMAIYEWYIPGFQEKHWRYLPWISGETALKNLRYWKSKEIEWVTYESQYAYEDKPYPLRWPLFYTVAMGMWDLSLTADEIMQDACKKLFGDASTEMFSYYKTLEQAMGSTELHSNIWNLPNAKEIFTEPIRKTAREQLQKALDKTKNLPGLAYWRVKEEQEVWSLAERTLDQINVE